ncbi:MAG: hypothetical protein LBC68_07035 [Prevotellaceae bacterium]|jgi:hypothetical protein|nr:hypothetical protein [Prevotellaceae bacterium]
MRIAESCQLRYTFLRANIILIAVLCAYACSPQTFRQGDLLFQTSSGSDFGNAVESATADTVCKFAHVGIVIDKRTVIEAIESGVVLTPIDTFLGRDVQTYIYKLKSEYQYFIPSAIKYCLNQTTAHYDSAFLPNNGKFYCSELICEAFKFANNGNDFFPLQPMTFKANGEFLPFWVEWYKNLNKEIPEGVLGSNPTALSHDGRLFCVTSHHHKK